MRADLHELASFNDVNDEYSSAAAARAATKPRGPSNTGRLVETVFLL